MTCKYFYKNILTIVVGLLCCIPAAHCFAQENSQITFIENKGQWADKIDFKLELNAGDVYFEGHTTTYNLFNKSIFGKAHRGEQTDSIIKGHAYTTTLLNANDEYLIIKENPYPHYFNYYIGTDESKWQGDVKAYDHNYFKNIYNGIDQTYYAKYGELKYDFIVSPEGNPYEIQIAYDGVENLKISKGHLIITTSIGDVMEQSPYAYQVIDGVETRVNCKYVLKKNILSFDFPDNYNPSLELIIDPILSFSTYTGSSASNFGCTATNDADGNMYVGGTVFGVGYPVTTGAYQTTIAGGIIDMGITKFSANGSSLLYSTYLGGLQNEVPHSLVVNNLNELYVLGSSNSTDYPTTAGSFQQVLGGGATLFFGNGYGFTYDNGTDIVVSKFNPAGSALLASTFFGGTGNDGINYNSIMHFNYGDAFRGEIINGLGGNIIFTSTTSSTDFPLNGAFQTTLNGPSDAVVVSLNSTLSSVVFSSYYGGDDNDNGYSVQMNSFGEIYFCGGTLSTDLPNVSNGMVNVQPGGDADGYVARLSANGNTLLNATYIGTTGYDQCFFLQTDSNDDIFTIGQTDGTYPILNSLFNNPNSGQFIQKLSPDLSTSLMSTTIGTGSGEVDISISAFLISDCNFIYLSGWGGATLNGEPAYNSHAFFSTTNNLPITADAYQSTTDGNDFYVAVLGPDASSLLYGTFFGGNISMEHVDGGTSRFDKNGNMYQAVCAGCGGNSDFPYTPGAWSPLNNNHCNLGAFKFDLGSITPSISVPQPFVCIPSSYQFNNNSSGGNLFAWDFGDGTTSNLFEPSHVYTDTGHFEVTLVVSDSLNCLTSDTAYLEIDVFALDNAGVLPIDSICSNDSALLVAGGGATYEWFPPSYLSNPTGQSTYSSPPFSTDYMVVATDDCGSDTAYVRVNVYNDTYSTMPDTTICTGATITLEAYGGVSYAWHSDPTILNPGNQTPDAIPSANTTYYVDITTASGCTYTDSVNITVILISPIPNLNNDTTICIGNNFELTAHNGDSYDWSPNNLLTDINGGNATTDIYSSAYIYVTATNACGSIMDSIYITVIEVFPQINPDTTICPGDTVLLSASGGDAYSWTPSASILYPDSNISIAIPTAPTQYTVNVSNTLGCSKSLSTNVFFYPKPIAHINGDSFLNYGHEVSLEGVTNADIFYWESMDSIYCTSCLATFAKPEETNTYIFNVEDTNGCKNSDTLTVILDGALYVPNTFTPNGDGVNDFFTIKGKEIKTFNLLIFNRWGQLIFESDSMNYQWDGTHHGRQVLIDTYVWKIEYEDNQQKFEKLIGHVNVIR